MILKNDSSAPGGKRLQITMNATNQYSAYWTLPNPATLFDYDGTYLIYLVCRADKSNTLQARFNNDDVKGDWVDILDMSSFGTSAYNATLLGQFRLPSQPLIPTTPVTTFTPYTVKFEVQSLAGSATTDFRVWELFLVPVDEGVTGMRTLAIFPTISNVDFGGVIDGDIPTHRYLINGDQLPTITPEPIGGYLTLHPAQHNFLYFFTSLSYPTLPGANRVFPDDEFDVTVDIIQQYLTLRD